MGWADRSAKKSKIGLSKKIDLILNVKDGSKYGTSEAAEALSQVTDRNFDIAFRSYKPELNFRPKSNFRLVLKYESIEKNQTINNLESFLHRIRIIRRIKEWR